MILPIVSYGSPILNKVAKEITSDYSNLNELINNMWETMYSAQGVGLAAPQVGVPIRLFVIDASPFVNEKTMNNQEIETLKKFKKIFINPKITLEEGKMCDFNEGCLSIPEVREDISRKEQITLEYFDEKFNHSLYVHNQEKSGKYESFYVSLIQFYITITLEWIVVIF